MFNFASKLVSRSAVCNCFPVLNAATAGRIGDAAGTYHYDNCHHAEPGAGHPPWHCLRPHGFKDQCGMHTTVMQHTAQQRDSQVLLHARVRLMCNCCAPNSWSSNVFDICAVLLVRLLWDRIKKLRAVRAQWSEIGVDDWEISQSDVKCAHVVACRLAHVPMVAAPLFSTCQAEEGGRGSMVSSKQNDFMLRASSDYIRLRLRVAEDVEGQDIVLGRGTFGLVVQGLKGGVQPVVSCSSCDTCAAGTSKRL
jgi:hypothetical protein